MLLQCIKTNIFFYSVQFKDYYGSLINANNNMGNSPHKAHFQGLTLKVARLPNTCGFLKKLLWDKLI